MMTFTRRGLAGLALGLGLGLALGSGLPVSAQPAAAAGKTEPLSVVTGAGRHVFQVEIADTDEARAQGLMFRTALAADAGMLFDFKREQETGFWMKNTYVSLDMIFVKADGRIHRIAEATTPLSEALVPSNGPVRFVLEVVAGTARRLGLKAGDRIEHRLVRVPAVAP
jgi:hypothetical protein